MTVPGAGDAGSTRDTGATRTDAEDAVAEIWKPGDVILDLYEVKEILGEGGFGTVFKIHHRGWNMDLAVKSPRAGLFKSDREKKNFIDECQTWIDLGLHPHAVSCYYVRTLGGIPRVFTELVDGKDLKHWIAEKKTKDVKTALDIAIQIAWGMAFAHEKGLVHRNLKPDNVLMTSDGTAKVTDFGLARHGIVSSEEDAQQLASGIQVSTAAGTPGYMAPEQASAGSQIDHRADVFAFGVTLWRMLGGRIPWTQTSPVVAKRSVEEILKKTQGSTLRPELVEFILRCLEPEPEDRWADFSAVVDQLRTIWSGLVGDDYVRPAPKAGHLLADGLNNRGVSLLDLGQAEKAEEAFDQALKADPHHTEATYNRGLVLWRSAQMTDQELVRQLGEIRTTHTDEWLDEYYLGLVHLERGDSESAERLLREASDQADDDRLVQSTLKSLRDATGTRSHGVRTLRERFGVLAVAISVDGRWGLSGGWRNDLIGLGDKVAHFWDLSTGRRLRTLKGHKGCVYSVAISPDGRWGLTGSADTKLRLWELSSGRCVRVLHGHGGIVTSVAISSDGLWGLSGSLPVYHQGADCTIRLWELSTGRCVRTLPGREPIAGSVAFNVEDGSVLSGNADKTLKLWELETGRGVRTFEGHAGAVNSVAISQDGHWGLSGSVDNTLRLWELATGRCEQTFSGHRDDVTSVALSGDNRLALSGSYDKTLRLWEVSTGRCLRTLQGHEDIVRSVAISNDGSWGLSGSTDKTLRLWELKRLSAPLAIAVPRSAIELGDSPGW